MALPCAIPGFFLPADRAASVEVEGCCQAIAFGIDTIDLTAWTEIADFADLKVHATSRDGDLWIEAGRNVLIIEGSVKRDLEPGDFLR